MHSLVSTLQWDFEALTGTLSVVPLESDLRDECALALKPPGKYPDILYALLLYRSTIVTLLRPKSHSIHPSDLHILLNTINASSALRMTNSESWLPICLPRFNSKGFVHAFISFFGDEQEDQIGNASAPDPKENGDSDFGVVLITGDREGFFDMRAWKAGILEVSQLAEVINHGYKLICPILSVSLSVCITRHPVRLRPSIRVFGPLLGGRRPRLI